MSDKTWPPPISFEHLSVEILWQIFALLTPQEFAAAFSGLNVFIDSIITSVADLSFVIKGAKDIELLPFFGPRIIRLVIIDSKEEVDLTLLINLRSLTLTQRARAHFYWIRPHNVPLLEILHVDGGN